MKKKNTPKNKLKKNQFNAFEKKSANQKKKSNSKRFDKSIENAKTA